MSNQQALSTPEEDVTTLLQSVADEHGLELAMDMPVAAGQLPQSQKVETPADDLNERLAKLRAGG